MLQHLDIVTIVSTIGYIGILLVIFCESALFLGFFLPGDSLLFTAGLLASKGLFNLPSLIVGVAAAAFIGYAIAYWFGIRLGHWLMNQPDRAWFKKDYLVKAHDFYAKHGGQAIILGRLMPIIRTFVPIAAGMAEMKYSRFIIYNAIGGSLWAFCIPFAGYYLGNLLPNSEKYLLPCVLLIVFISISPGIYQWLRYKFTAR